MRIQIQSVLLEPPARRSKIYDFFGNFPKKWSFFRKIILFPSQCTIRQTQYGRAGSVIRFPLGPSRPPANYTGPQPRFDLGGSFSSFGEQLFGAALDNNFGERLWGTALWSSFGEQLWEAGAALRDSFEQSFSFFQCMYSQTSPSVTRYFQEKRFRMPFLQSTDTTEHRI